VRVGGASPSVAQPFWDPVCQLEGQCVRRLGTRGPMRLEDLLAAVDWAPQLGQASTGEGRCFRGALTARLLSQPCSASSVPLLAKRKRAWFFLLSVL
jgi:hypothetical protein